VPRIFIGRRALSIHALRGFVLSLQLRRHDVNLCVLYFRLSGSQTTQV
jgi:hypothetical protein